MPVRFLVYVAMTALTRMLIADMPVDHKPGIGIVYITGSILLLAVANLVVRYSSAKYPGAGPAAEEAARGRADSK
jgi:phosphate starvation-inducible membrane PsiE